VANFGHNEDVRSWNLVDGTAFLIGAIAYLTDSKCGEHTTLEKTKWDAFRCPNTLKCLHFTDDNAVNYWVLINVKHEPFGILFRPDYLEPEIHLLVSAAGRSLALALSTWGYIGCDVCNVEFSALTDEFRKVHTYVKQMTAEQKLKNLPVRVPEVPSAVTEYLDALKSFFNKTNYGEDGHIENK